MAGGSAPWGQQKLGLEVMTANMEEGKYGGRGKMCLWRYRVL